jgi:hypothetical protein
MDDLILWIAYNTEQKRSLTEAEKIKSMILEKDVTYTGGLILEEQKYETITPYLSRHKFAGTIIILSIDKGKVRLQCEPQQKNWPQLITKGTQEYPRFIDFHSYTPYHYKKGTQITTYYRLAEQSSNEEILLEAMVKNAIEMYSLGYDTNFLLSTLSHLSRNSTLWGLRSIIFSEKLISNEMVLGSLKSLLDWKKRIAIRINRRLLSISPSSDISPILNTIATVHLRAQQT